MSPAVLAERIAPGVQCVLAPNPGPMTRAGTNSYVVGTGPVAVIDPGVDDPAHLATLRAVAGAEIAAILVTHRHPDHGGGAAALAAATGAPVRALPKARLSAYDRPLQVDQPLADGETIALGAITLEAVHAPGHAADHLCFLAHESGLLFAGDCVMADATVVILPPDGDMSAYFASLERLRALPLTRIAPGHGRMLDDPGREFARIVAHRRAREAQVRQALTAEPQSAAAIAATLYPELEVRLQPMAAAQVEAHLLRLTELGLAQHRANGDYVAMRA